MPSTGGIQETHVAHVVRSLRIGQVTEFLAVKHTMNGEFPQKGVVSLILADISNNKNMFLVSENVSFSKVLHQLPSLKNREITREAQLGPRHQRGQHVSTQNVKRGWTFRSQGLACCMNVKSSGGQRATSVAPAGPLWPHFSSSPSSKGLSFPEGTSSSDLVCRMCLCFLGFFSFSPHDPWVRSLHLYHLVTLKCSSEGSELSPGGHWQPLPMLAFKKQVFISRTHPAQGSAASSSGLSFSVTRMSSLTQFKQVSLFLYFSLPTFLPFSSFLHP